MRIAIGLGVCAAMLAALPATAAVPLHMQRRGELHRVIDLPVMNRMGPIDRVERIAPDTWRVTAGRCFVDVRMIARPGVRPGLTPPIYEPRPGRPVCRR